MPLRVTVLGSGTSTGVPVIGCRCSVCTSTDPRNRRLRPGLRLELEGGVALVDAPTDLRQQALRFGLDRVDAVVFTHAHADHVFGLDDLRIFNFRQRVAIPCYGSAATLAALRRMFAYAFEDGQEGGGKPRLELVEVSGPFRLLGREVVPVPVLHGDLPVLGYRLGGFAYVTDCNFIPESSMQLLSGLEVLILDALRYRPHSTHFSVAEAIAVARRLGARRTYFTHMTHEVDHSAPAAELPPGVEFGYDGLVLDVA
jgi:phosphoribosyl 1,2-cyclic phosphate phosphodiesterase